MLQKEVVRMFEKKCVLTSYHQFTFKERLQKYAYQLFEVQG